MKKTVRIIAVLLAVLMFVGAFAACSKEQTDVKTGGKYSFWVALDNSVAQTLTSFNELMMYQEMIERTGTNVEFIHPASGTTGTEAFQILLSAGDYPDMIQYNWAVYPSGPDQAIKDGVIIALNDYMEDYAPNYYYYMEGEGGKEKDYSYKAGSISNGGNYYGFKNLNIGNYKGYAGLFVRADLLKKWNLDVPETIDEWENVFKTAKENGIKYPLTGDKSIVGARTNDYFNTAWNIGNGLYVDNGKVKFGPFQPEFKEYVQKMRDWVKKGYLDIDYVTNNTTIVRGQIANGTSIAAAGFVGGDFGSILPAAQEKNPEFDLVACPYPVMKKGDTPILQAIQADATDPCIAVSTQCGIEDENRYKEAIAFCDYLYSDEGIILKSFGVEGETFTVEKDKDGNDHYVYTDKVKNYEEFGATNMSGALYHFMLPANHPGFNQHPDYFEGYYAYDRQKEAIEVWNKYVDVAVEYALPPVQFTGEEATEATNIEISGKDNLQAGISNIILGKLSMDEYDNVIKAAKDAGYERLVEINQAAYERYMKVIGK